MTILVGILGRYFSHNLVAANVPKRMELDFVDQFAMSHGSSCSPPLGSPGNSGKMTMNLLRT